MEHEIIVLAHEEKFKSIENRLTKLEENSEEIVNLAKQLVGMRVELTSAITETKTHISNGWKYRLAIIAALFGLAGIWHSETVKYGVFQEKINAHDKKIQQLDQENKDLNYTKGYAVGLAEQK